MNRKSTVKRRARALRVGPKKSAKFTIASASLAAGGVVPINLTLGRNFGKSDKVMVKAECCGPYRQHCSGIKGPF